MLTEHYDTIEIMTKQEVPKRVGGRALKVSYVVRKSSTPGRVGYPGEFEIRIETGLEDVNRNVLESVSVGDFIQARFAERPAAVSKYGDAVVGSELRLDRVWKKRDDALDEAM